MQQLLDESLKKEDLNQLEFSFILDDQCEKRSMQSLAQSYTNIHLGHFSQKDFLTHKITHLKN